MKILEKITPQAARAAGFVVDTGVYPWFGYKGPRFAPLAHVRVYTDLEASLMEQVARTQAPALDKKPLPFALCEDPLTVALLSKELRSIRQLGGSGEEVEIRVAAVLKRLLAVTYQVLEPTRYSFETSHSTVVDDAPYVDIFFQRGLQGESARWYVAEIHVQATWCTIAISGKIVHAVDRWRRYDDAADVATFAHDHSDEYEYADLLASLLAELDEQVDRVTKLEDAKDAANATQEQL